MNKQSKSVKYLKLDSRKAWKGATWGFTTRSTDENLKSYQTFASVGWNTKKTYMKMRLMLNFHLMDIYHQMKVEKILIWNMKINLKLVGRLTDRVRLYNLGEISKLQGTQFYKAKIGVEFFIDIYIHELMEILNNGYMGK